MLPFEFPHLASVFVVDAVGPPEFETLTVLTYVQPFASLTTTLYVPAVKLLNTLGDVALD